MGNYDYAYRLYGCISTGDTLINKPQLSLDLFEQFQKRIAEPLGKQIHYEAYGKRIKGICGNLYDQNWDRVKKIMCEGKINEFTGGYMDFDLEARQISYKTNLNKWFPPDVIVLNSSSKENEQIPRSIIEFSVVHWMYRDGIPSNVTDCYIDLICNISNKVHNTGGLITLDYVGTPYGCETAHERYTSTTYKKTFRLGDKYFRGYQWGNILSDKHIELLGGKEKIEKEAPVYRTIPLNDGGMFLQLTSDVNKVKDEDLRRLKNYFKPILYYPDDPSLLYPQALDEMRVIID